MIDTYRRAVSDCYETFNVNSHQNQMKKALRAMRGYPYFQFQVTGGEAEAEFLADFSSLTGDDRNDETKLSAALEKLLKMAMEMRNEKAGEDGSAA
jgi:hypothetical protein